MSSKEEEDMKNALILGDHIEYLRSYSARRYERCHIHSIDGVYEVKGPSYRKKPLNTERLCPLTHCLARIYNSQKEMGVENKVL